MPHRLQGLQRAMRTALLTLLGLGVAVAADAADGSHFLADRHAERGVKCVDCHGAGTPTADVSANQCLKCHGGTYKALAAKTDSDDINPHDTHLGEQPCTTCHAGHKQPQLSCDGCHEFPDIKVP